MDLKEFKTDFESDLKRGFSHAKYLEKEIKWLIEQAEKVEELDKRLNEQIQNNHCIICGDDATEFRQGGYYCYECCK
jgi:hypothetical protein